MRLINVNLVMNLVAHVKINYKIHAYYVAKIFLLNSITIA
jgi:hypothetical protein